MKKHNYFKDLKDIQAMTDKVKTLNESLAFADEYDDPEDVPQGQSMDEAPYGEEVEDEEDMVMEESSAIEQIREIALKGMVQLSKNTDNAEYEILKKIFLMVDKVNDKKPEGEPKR